MADTETIAIDPRVALQETTAKAAADAAWYRERCLLLAQTVFDLQGKVEELAAVVEEQNAALATLRAEADGSAE